LNITPTRELIPVFALILALGVGACADEPTGPGDNAEDPNCSPMTTRACSCEVPSEMGTRTCLGSGLAWSNCVCLGDGATDVSPTDGGPDPITLEPGFRAVTPLAATGQLTSPNYRLRLFVAAPATSEPLVSPHYELTLGAPNPIH